MSSCETQTFTGITQSRFDCLTQAAQGTGVTITGNAGEASKDGITIRWQYDPAGQVLELQCMKSPSPFLCGIINGKLQDLVNGCP
ncbi:MAG TPA: hypothetical protein VGG72_07975 [Bryobacteraceae bacterium]|jgi:hypothetical protein